jgi:hypothetical protein
MKVTQNKHKNYIDRCLPAFTAVGRGGKGGVVWSSGTTTSTAAAAYPRRLRPTHRLVSARSRGSRCCCTLPCAVLLLEAQRAELWRATVRDSESRDITCWCWLQNMNTQRDITCWCWLQNMKVMAAMESQSCSCTQHEHAEGYYLLVLVTDWTKEY